ncbi:MAG: hypothetical protein ACO3RB_03945 [Ilumatobacteraceae bacterium]
MTTMRRAAAAATCGVLLSLGGLGAGTSLASTGTAKPNPIQLTAEQHNCLAAAKAKIPAGTAKAVRRVSMKAAAQSCGIWKKFARLSTDQRACLASNGLTANGAPTRAKKKQLRSLAAKCGITLRVKG